MSSTIRIKRSGATVSPTTLSSGEIAYSWAAGAGGKLYLGTGSEIVPGEAPNIDVIGGKLYVDMLDHVAGTLTASSAIVTDSSNKIDQIRVGNLVATNNSITATTGDLVFNATSGVIDFSGKRATNGAAAINPTDYVILSQLSSANVSMSVIGDTGSDIIPLASDTLSFIGGIGISTAVSNNAVTYNLKTVGGVANTYGSSVFIPVITVDTYGRITSITTAGVGGSSNTVLSIGADSGNNDLLAVGVDTLRIIGGVGTSTIVGNNSIAVSLTNTAVTPTTYGNANTVGTFTVDQQGRITGATATKINIQASAVSDFTEVAQDAAGSLISTGQQSGVLVSYDDTNNRIDFNVNDFRIDITGSVVGNATVTNLANTTISVAIQNDSVTLGTHTTGNYVASLVAGAGVSLANNTGETATPTISIGQDVSRTANIVFRDGTFTGSLTVDGDITVSGNTFIINATNLAVQDNMIYLNSPAVELISSASGNGSAVVYVTTNTNTLRAGMSVFITGITPSGYNANNIIISTANSTSFTAPGSEVGGYVSGGTAEGRFAANPDIGFIGGYNDLGFAYTGMFRDATDARFKLFKGYTANPSVFIDVADPSFAFADLQANTVYASVVGNASTASRWATPRQITLAGDLSGAVTFDGSGNVTLTANVVADSIALGTDTTGNYVQSITNGSFITGGNGGSEGAAITLAVNASASAGSLTIVNRDAAGNFAANNVTAALIGNASTATTLQTPRNINGVPFDGSGNIVVSANTTNAVTFNNGGAGVASGSTFNGGTAVTISHNTIGASPVAGSASITTVGVVTSGSWNANTIGPAQGGTGKTDLQTSMAALEGYQTIVSSGGSTSLTATSSRNIIITGTSTHTILLPDVTTLELGRTYVIQNTSTGTVTVQSSGGNGIGSTILTAHSGRYTCIALTGTGTSSWVNALYAGSTRSGTGSSVFSIAPTMSGINFATSATQAASTNSQGSATIGVTQDNIVITSAASNPSGLTLPASTSNIGRRIVIHNRGANIVNVYPQVAATIDTLGINNPIALPVNGVVEFNSSNTSQWYSSFNTIQSTSMIVGNFAASVDVAAGTGLSISGAAANNVNYVISGINANNTVKGVASFDVSEFIVSAGMVTINSIDGGTY